MRLNQVTVGCTDYAASVAFYRRLGLTQIVDAPPGYARFETPTGETFSIHGLDAVRGASTVIYFEIDTLDEAVAALRDAGIAFDSGPRDERWGWREARLRDPAGNRLCLYRAGEYRRFPPWRIGQQTNEKENSK
ncbi:MAG: VOC family protein [Parasphingopyxis sp.]|uniref:VOC family protein n=1 Tax=Parasphingopyxis sp. TaxID=1920299 RepID=UPI003F9F6524